MRIVLATAPTLGDRRPQVENLGIRYLAAVAREVGHDAVIIEATDSSASISDFTSWLLSERPDVVGFGVQFSQQARTTAQAADALHDARRR